MTPCEFCNAPSEKEHYGFCKREDFMALVNLVSDIESRLEAFKDSKRWVKMTDDKLVFLR